MTVTEMVSLVGKGGQITYDGMAFNVWIHDVRINFGRMEVQVCPTLGKAGNGKKWVSLDRIRF